MKAMPDVYRFPIMAAASVVVLALIIRIVLLGGKPPPRLASVLLVAVLVSGGGMIFAKFGANAGLDWRIYFTVPALLTIFLPPVVFKMSLSRTAAYIVLAGLSAPAIHFFFSAVFGWREYMPFLEALST